MVIPQHSQRLLPQNGKYVIVPPWKEGQQGWGNAGHPNVHLAGANTQQQYPTHTRFVDFDREFIYGYMESASSTAKANLGMFNTNVQETITFGTVAKVAGDTTLGLLTPTTDETTAAANIFAGGYFMPRTNPYGAYRVVSNTAYNEGVVGSTEMDIVIESPGLGAAVTASQASSKLSRDPYTALRCEWAAGNTNRSVVGVGLILPVVATYQWFQVVGPCMLLGDEAAGGAANLREVWWHQDGSVVATGQGTPTNTVQKILAGHILDMTANDYTWLIQMLRLG